MQNTLPAFLVDEMRSHLRNLLDRVHAALRHRARRRGASQRRSTAPSIDDWLEELAELPAHRLTRPAAETVAQARDEDEAWLAGARVSG
jgi:hypothetical protein